MSEPLLRAASIGKRLSHAWVLRDVSFSVDAASLVALMGPNGAGKSTLLSILATILAPSSGEAWIGGQHIVRESSGARRHAGYLGHASGLYGGMTAWENLWLAGKLFGVADLRGAVSSALDRAGLSDRRDTVVRHYSKGMARKLAFERVMLHRPSLLLLDEPFDGLDVAARERFEERLRGHRDGGGSALIVTHDPEQARRLCDRSLVLENGRVS